MKIALVHDFLVQDGGAERVLKVLSEMYPQAPIYTLLYHPEKVDSFFTSRKIVTSPLQKNPLAGWNYRFLLKAMPQAIESFNFDEFDLVISSASAFAKGVKTNNRTKHICYCHTPTRYLWSDGETYVKELPYNPIIKKVIPLLLKRLRSWDLEASKRPDYYIANSKLIARRIAKYYDRQAEQVIYPPVDTGKFSIQRGFKDYFLAGGRLVAYKKFDLVIKAFNRLGWPLKIFGTGPELDNLKRIAKVNIEFLGYVSDKELPGLYANCKAFIHPQLEDFGIVLVEAMASGRPVIAFDAGGAKETVIDKTTGIMFKQQKVGSLMQAIKVFRERDFDSEVIRNHAKKFDKQCFEDGIRKFVTQKI